MNAITTCACVLLSAPETTSTATTATHTSMYVTSSQENQTTAEMAIDQDTSPRQTTLRRTTEVETSKHLDTPDITTGPTTTRHGKTEKPSTAGDATTRQTTERERSSTVGLMIGQTSDQYKFIEIIVITLLLHI